MTIWPFGCFNDHDLLGVGTRLEGSQSCHGYQESYEDRTSEPKGPNRTRAGVPLPVLLRASESRRRRPYVRRCLPVSENSAPKSSVQSHHSHRLSPLYCPFVLPLLNLIETPPPLSSLFGPISRGSELLFLHFDFVTLLVLIE